MVITAQKFIKLKSGFSNPKGKYEITSDKTFFRPSKTISGELENILEEYYEFRRANNE